MLDKVGVSSTDEKLGGLVVTITSSLMVFLQSQAMPSCLGRQSAGLLNPKPLHDLQAASSLCLYSSLHLIVTRTYASPHVLENFIKLAKLRRGYVIVGASVDLPLHLGPLIRALPCHTGDDEESGSLPERAPRHQTMCAGCGRPLAPGNWTLRARMEGYQTAEAVVWVPADGSGAVHNFTLRKAPLAREALSEPEPAAAAANMPVGVTKPGVTASLERGAHKRGPVLLGGYLQKVNLLCWSASCSREPPTPPRLAPVLLAGGVAQG